MLSYQKGEALDISAVEMARVPDDKKPAQIRTG